MHLQDPITLALLQGMIARLHVDRALGEDLHQEALIDLWVRESRWPGQQRSWYLRGCWLHLMNVLRSGRSIDDLKHRAHRAGNPETLDFAGARPEAFCSASDVFSEVSAHDLLRQLTPQLTSTECETLRLLTEGFTGREVARLLHLSHTAVAKRRRKIARVARYLGVQPPRRCRRRAFEPV